MYGTMKIVYLHKITVFIAVVLNLDEIKTKSKVKRNIINVQSTKFKMPAVIDKKTYVSVNRFESLAVDDESNDSDSIITDRQDNGSNRKYINEFIFSTINKRELSPNPASIQNKI
jgi:hypothetical protein